MDGKRSLGLVALMVCNLALHAEQVGQPEPAPPAEVQGPPMPPKIDVDLFTELTSPMKFDECQLGGRRFGCHLHPKKKRKKMHSGWDFQARPLGMPRLRAVGNGVVVKAGRLSSICGNGVMIQLEKKLFAYYCHMSKVDKLKVGDKVKSGQEIGNMGESGVCQGPHLHFVMSTCPQIGQGCAVDPAKFFKPKDMCKQSLPDETEKGPC